MRYPERPVTSEPGGKRFAHSLTVMVKAPHQIIEESLKEMLASNMYNVAVEACEADVALIDLCYDSEPYPLPPSNVPALALVKGEEDNLAGILSRGYRGYLDYDTTPLILFKALETVANGDIWAERKLIKKILDPPKNSKLTQREREVERLLLEGLSNPSIAERLGISVSTVKAHITSIFQKVGVKSRVEFILKYK